MVDRREEDFELMLPSFLSELCQGIRAAVLSEENRFLRKSFINSRVELVGSFDAGIDSLSVILVRLLCWKLDKLRLGILSSSILVQRRLLTEVLLIFLCNFPGVTVLQGSFLWVCFPHLFLLGLL